MIKRLPFVLALLTTISLSGDLRAQEADRSGTVDELRSMVTEATSGDRDRQTILDFLSRTAVEDVAEEYGVDIERAREGVKTLDVGQAGQLAERIRQTDQPAQVGGDTFVISSTAVIIGLLVIILIIVA